MSLAPQLKYKNKPTTLGGLRFASRAEAKRFGELKLLERAGQINNLVVQPRYPLIVNGITVGTYIADFSYREASRFVIEDVKSPVTKTQLYKLKIKILKATLGFVVNEIEA